MATVTITITPVNDAPVAVNDSYTAIEDTTLTIPALGVLANDIDVDGDLLTSLLVTNVLHGTLNLATNGAFTYTPSLNYTGVDTFSYRATDGALTSDVATVTITITPVNDAPVAANDLYSTLEDTTLTVLASGVLANDTDVDGDPLRAVLVSGTTHGTLNLGTNGAFTYTPSLNYTGVDFFTYRATDGVLTSDVATVGITITPVNDAPVAVDDSYTVAEDTALTILAPGVLGNDTDVDGDTLRVASFTQPAHGTLSLTRTNGAFTYTPSLNYTGLDTFTYRATDGALTSAVATVRITITPVNDAPVASADNYTATEDTTLTINAATGVLVNDSDVDGDALFAVLASNPAHGTLNLSASGAFTYTPSLNYTGLDTFTYRATDSALTSGVATVTITITPVNDAPVAVDDAYTINEDTILNLAAPGVLANDSDVDGDLLTAVLVANPAHGTLALNANGSFLYRPATNFNGTDTFTYRATDGALTSGVATVTITINPTNDAPAAISDDAYVTLEDTVLTVPPGGVLTNDVDVDADLLTAVLVSTTTNGTLTLSTNGGFVYVPNTNFNGVDHFTYRATDGALTSDVAVVTITVTPVNDVPVAVNDSYSVNEDTALVISVPGVLSNDLDVDGAALAPLLVSDVQHGTLNLSTNGAFTYTPSLNYTGVDTFTYRATDGALTSDVATVTITILPVNDLPVAAPDSYSVNEDTTLVISVPGVLSNDSDVDGDPLSAVLVSDVTHGTLSLGANGAFIYTPSLNYTGLDTFTYRATDGALTSGVATVTITIIPVNDPPVTGIEGDSYTVLEDRTLTVAKPGVLANDFDVDGDALQAVFVSGPAHGTLVLNANGSFSYVPAANYFGPDSFIYRASDGLTSSAPASVSLTVTPVNDAPTFTSGSDQKVNRNAPAQTVPSWAANISPGPANESAQTLAFLVSNDNPSLFSVQPAIAANGTLTYTPAANVFGVANVHVFLRDNGGTANGGADTSGEVVFRIAVNSPPSVSIISPANGVGLLAPATFSVVASASDPDGTVTNVLFMLNGTNFTSVAQAPFYFVLSNAVPGNYQWRAVATDNAGLSATSAVVTIEVITNTVVATGPIVLNHQNGLFEQFVTVSNRTSETWANGVRLFVKDLDTTNKVYNATGTNNGTPYLDKIVSVPPGGRLIITVQYYVPNPRVFPVPTLVATPLPFTTVTVRPQLTRPSRVEGGVLPLQFTTQSGRFYFIQHSEDLVHWTTEPAAVAGTGGVVVVPQSATGDKRFYRVLLIP